LTWADISTKGGSAGKWQTTHQKAKQSEQMELGRTLEVNDAGIWVTYARGMKGKAIREFKSLCDEVCHLSRDLFRSILWQE
jgi:tRNA acetyltransferase TAN1